MEGAVIGSLDADIGLVPWDEVSPSYPMILVGLLLHDYADMVQMLCTATGTYSLGIDIQRCWPGDSSSIASRRHTGLSW